MCSHLFFFFKKMQMELVIYGLVSLTSNPDTFLGWNVNRLNCEHIQGDVESMGRYHGTCQEYVVPH